MAVSVRTDGYSSSKQPDDVESTTKQVSSLEKLMELKTKLQKELQASEKEKQIYLQEEAVIPLSLVDEYRDQKGRKGKLQMQNQQDKSTKLSKASAKQRDIELLMESHERERKVLEQHNLRLRCIIDLRRQSSNRKETRCREQIGELKQKLDRTITARVDQATSLQEMRDTNKKIQGKVSQLQSTIEQQAEVEKMNLVRQFRVKMHELKKELNEERQANITGAQEWIDKNNLLTHELNNATETLNKITSSNVKLALENKDLKIRFKSQEEERQSVVRHVTTMRKENRRLTEHVVRLQEEVIQISKEIGKKRNLDQTKSTAAGSGTSAVKNQTNTTTAAATTSDVGMSGNVVYLKPGQTSVEYEAKYLEVINKVKRQLEHERRILKQVRSSHIELLQERTELEVFLRQCLHDARKEIAKDTATCAATRNQHGLKDYHVEDRRNLLDLLLSKERVLTVLYAKAFPYRLPQDSLASEIDCVRPTDNILSSTSAELDMDTLWTKWKAWAERPL
eukprot:TRINITY_DN5310_c0_g1_i1.p1 TRINITY_DN5310_c0_g1~~TRINITY_DN5310_c0_g1_i1.p1  ORF type:complete len:509 (+),score=137.16 TRINITY_DN5310_c0_g1_i1:1930-3456(+)